MSDEREFRRSAGQGQAQQGAGPQCPQALVAECCASRQRAAAASAGAGADPAGAANRAREGTHGVCAQSPVRPGRRVLVKALPVRHRIGGRRMAPLSARICLSQARGRHPRWLRREAAHVRRRHRPRRRSRLRGAVQGRPPSFPLHRIARRCGRDDRPHAPSPATLPGRWRPTWERGSTGWPSITGTPTTRTSICWCAASTTTGRRSGDRARLYQPGPALARRGSGLPSNSAPKPEHEIRNALERRSRRSAGPASIPRSARCRRGRRHRPAPRDNAGAADPGHPPPDDRPPAASGEDGPRRRSRPRRMAGRLEAERKLARSRQARRHHQDHAPRASPSSGQDRGVADYVIERRGQARRSSAGWSTRACTMN